MPFASAVMALFPAPPRSAQATPTAAPTDTNSLATGLTNEAKQAMISSLQLDITERARRLRQQYNEQAQQLRTRLERRLNRLPQKLRTKTMGELAEDHAKAAADSVRQEKSGGRPLKRSSTHAFGVDNDDKENQSQLATDEPQGQKKRTKLAKPQNVPLGAKSTATQPRSHANILSPRSHNSRTLPRSPVKFQSPAKPLPTSTLARPRAAPKTTAATNARAPSRAISRQGIAGAQKAANKSNIESESEGRESESSATSAVTTIVKKSTTSAAAKRAPAARKPSAKAPAAATRKRAPAKKKVEPAATTTRTLRSRA